MITFSSDTNFTDTLNPTDKGYPAIVEPVTGSFTTVSHLSNMTTV